MRCMPQTSTWRSKLHFRFKLSSMHGAMIESGLYQKQKLNVCKNVRRHGSSRSKVVGSSWVCLKPKEKVCFQWAFSPDHDHSFDKQALLFLLCMVSVLFVLFTILLFCFSYSLFCCLCGSVCTRCRCLDALRQIQSFSFTFCSQCIYEPLSRETWLDATGFCDAVRRLQLAWAGVPVLPLRWLLLRPLRGPSWRSGLCLQRGIGGGRDFGRGGCGDAHSVVAGSAEGGQRSCI